MKTTKITAGHYEGTINGVTFELKKEIVATHGYSKIIKVVQWYCRLRWNRVDNGELNVANYADKGATKKEAIENGMEVLNYLMSKKEFYGLA